ncbi:hypothetical protein KKC60_04050, partial [Patescibacteria group bacterium]|nr:hypothetical protein [Patescibacteria group bacterium]
ISRLVPNSQVPKKVLAEAFNHLYRFMAGWGMLTKRTHWWMTVESRLVQQYIKMGFEVEIVTKGQFFEEGDECVVAMLDLIATKANLQKKSPENHYFFFENGHS